MHVSAFPPSGKGGRVKQKEDERLRREAAEARAVEEQRRAAQEAEEATERTRPEDDEKAAEAEDGLRQEAARAAEEQRRAVQEAEGCHAEEAGWGEWNR